jgi:succinate dehydrogenase/fumarate reductase flavoprotein subunit
MSFCDLHNAQKWSVAGNAISPAKESVGVFNQPLVDALELASMLDVAELVAGSALVRRESHGHHFRLDFPQQDDANWLKHTSVKQGPGGPEYGTRPVVVTRIPLPSGR